MTKNYLKSMSYKIKALHLIIEAGGSISRDKLQSLFGYDSKFISICFGLQSNKLMEISHNHLEGLVYNITDKGSSVFAFWEKEYTEKMRLEQNAKE